MTSSNDKEKLVFIGNGLDLNLGLKTSYKDFLNSPSFNDLLKNPTTNNEPFLAQHLNQIKDNNNWVNIELELSKFSTEKANEHFIKDYKNLCKSLTEYINNIQDTENFLETSQAFTFLESLCLRGKTTILNFNYTNTAQKILNNKYHKTPGINEKERPYEHFHIHGSAKDKNIIFGVDDTHKIGKGHIEIRKSSFNDKHGRIIKKHLRSANDIYFFGLSLGETDHMYFRDFFENISNKYSEKKLHFYHYGEEGRLQLHNQFETLTNQKVTALKSNNEFIFHDVRPKE